jgi:hypothetical protein
MNPDVPLQVYVDRIDPEAIVQVVDIDRWRAAPSWRMIDPGVDPRPLSARTRTGDELTGSGVYGNSWVVVAVRAESRFMG